MRVTHTLVGTGGRLTAMLEVLMGARVPRKICTVTSSGPSPIVSANISGVFCRPPSLCATTQSRPWR